LAEGAKPAVIITVPVYQRSADTDSISRHIGFINALVDVAYAGPERGLSGQRPQAMS